MSEAQGAGDWAPGSGAGYWSGVWVWRKAGGSERWEMWASGWTGVCCWGCRTERSQRRRRGSPSYRADWEGGWSVWEEQEPVSW